MKIGFTGSRKGMTFRQLHALSSALDERGSDLAEFHHGDCVGGDAEAHQLARALQLAGSPVAIHIHPPQNSRLRAHSTGATKTYEPLPYLVRNRHIVACVDLLIAAPDGPERQRSGTWATVRAARERGIPVVVLEP